MSRSGRLTADDSGRNMESPIPHASPTIAALGECAQNMLAAGDERAACLSGNDFRAGCEQLVKIAEEQADSLWSNLGQIALMLADRKSGNHADLRSKVGLWRRLAPESLFLESEQTPDEALLCSIIEDIERMIA